MSEATEEKLPLVYVGPTSTKLGLVRFSHYIELNERVQEAIKNNPALDILFIPLEQFGTRAPDIYAGGDSKVAHATKRLVKDGIL